MSMEEYEAATANRISINDDAVRGKDEKGRDMVECMTDRELLKETVLSLRALGDVLEAVGQSPMAAAMMPGFGRRK